ncbi:hypothetical protein DFP72DRAFT_407126 [Ephemerocybe angulata]|uniref:Ricin B lectin domain-containing protein n=1 Tax=Ephemerocybe angulata TaxID=980116 RepID=A0A8H6HUK4_9AGAR|nr:hypothetical protein DFP72DRAFT_407126 [Tulosesus angulatus]
MSIEAGPPGAGPADRGLQSGKTYKIASVKTGSALTINPFTREVIANVYKGTPLQVWDAVATPSGHWCFRNPETGLYFGSHLGKAVKDSSPIKATSHAFPWAVRRDNGGWSKLGIPYTNHVLDLDDHGGLGNDIMVQSWIWLGGDNQKWVVDADTRYEPPVSAGELYKIVSSCAGTVVHLEKSGDISGYEYNEGRNQQWEAVASGSDTWYLKNHFTGQYLGVEDSDLEVPEKATRVIATDLPFAWDIVPKYIGGVPARKGGVMLYIPYTELALNLEGGKKRPGTRIHLWINQVQYWILEKCTSTRHQLPEVPGI